MPYVSKEIRASIEERVFTPEFVAYIKASQAGTLNYLITRIADIWLDADPHYSEINTAVGVLECAKLELYRRVASPYEDLKMRENGDAYQERRRE